MCNCFKFRNTKKTANPTKATKPVFEMLMPDGKSRITISGENPLDAVIKRGRRIAEDRYELKTKDGENVVISLAKDGRGRVYLEEIEIDGKYYRNIQTYMDSGFAISTDGTFLGLDQIAPKDGRLVINLRDDSKFLGINKDFDLWDGEGMKDDKLAPDSDTANTNRKTNYGERIIRLLRRAFEACKQQFAKGQKIEQ